MPFHITYQGPSINVQIFTNIAGEGMGKCIWIHMFWAFRQFLKLVSILIRSWDVSFLVLCNKCCSDMPHRTSVYPLQMVVHIFFCEVGIWRTVLMFVHLWKYCQLWMIPNILLWIQLHLCLYNYNLPYCDVCVNVFQMCWCDYCSIVPCCLLMTDCIMVLDNACFM